MILLSFDTEEFDVPREHGVDFSLEEGMRVSIEGTNRILDVLRRYGVRATFFCTGNFAEHAPEVMQRIMNEGHEVACHGVDHWHPAETDFARSKEIIEHVTGRKVYGYRQPRMFPVSDSEIARVGYRYNSSLNPAFIPGRYMHLTAPRTWFMKGNVMHIPASVTPWVRFPLFWLSLHNLPEWLYRLLVRLTLKHDRYFVTYFHPWEFYDLKDHPEFKMPFIIRNHSGKEMVERLTVLFERMISEGQITENSIMVFVNDGNRDNTWQIFKELHHENKFVKGINLSHNVGHQNAIMAGMMTAREWADAVITIDAALQDDIECIPQMVRHFTEGNDIVYGVKVSRKADPLMKRMSAMVFYKLQSAMGVESVYNHADFRLLSQRALQMLSDYKESNLYLRRLIPMIGLSSTTVDDVISERQAGSSKYTLRKMLYLALDGVTSFSTRPMHVILTMGIFFLAIAFGIFLYVVHAWIAGTAVPGWSSLILSIWLVGGFILIAQGITGTYIGKIYTEVKHRPLYHIQDILE